jgi:hypothetical protein
MTTIYTRDSLVLTVSIQDDSGPKDLTGATVDAEAQQNDTVVDGVATVIDSPGGVVRCRWSPAALGVGNWEAHVWVTIGGDVQTVSVTRVTVKS